jgi:pyruvate carboxylase subunit B
MAKDKGLEFYEGNPQDAFPNELERFRQVMKEEGWDCGQDDEELFELAMHERQYRDYRSGVAKERFNKDLEAARMKAGAPVVVTRPVIEMPKLDVEAIMQKYPAAVPVQAPVKGQMLWQIDVDDVSSAPAVGTKVKEGEPMAYVQTYYGMEEVYPPASGKIVSICASQGDYLAKGEFMAFVIPE